MPFPHNAEERRLEKRRRALAKRLGAPDPDNAGMCARCAHNYALGSLLCGECLEAMVADLWLTLVVPSRREDL